MSEFEFIFALFGLLLGLSLTEVLGGLARAIQGRLLPGSTLRIGRLTPMLGTFVLLDLLSFWQAAWITRTVVAVSGPALLAVTLFASAYFLAASLVFPRDTADPTTGAVDYDAHFFRVRRLVIAVMLALLVCQLAFYASVPALTARLASPLRLGLTVVLAVLMLAAMVARGRRWCELTMGALIGRYLIVYLL
jgi:hypothetical protein